MIKKTIKYTDFNGTEREEDFYFNFTKTELTKLELSKDGGLSNIIKKIISANDTKEIIALFDEVILKAYGEKSDDGKKFIKGEEISEAFSQTPAYDILFMELTQSPDTAANFIKGLMPVDMQNEIEAQLKANSQNA